MKTILTHYMKRKLYWENKIKEFKENCPHENHTKIPRSDTGNYCESDDQFWYDCHCHDCGHFWKEDQ